MEPASNHMELPQVALLDGGFAQELMKHCQYNVHKDPLWTAKALYTDPDSIMKTHKAFVDAGVNIIETATYQATVSGFKQHLSLSEEESLKLFKDSVSLCRKAAEGKENRIVVAGSIGPYGVMLQDGSEYTGRYLDSVSKKELIETHLPRLRGLVEGCCDILAIETFPSLYEVKIIMDLIAEHFPHSKAWVSFSIKDEDPFLFVTAYGDDIEKAFHELKKYPQLWAFGINCCHPKYITPALKKISALCEGTKIRPIVYPNSGQEWRKNTGWIEDPKLPAVDTYVAEWIDLGAKVIGGCCQVGSDQISKIRFVINAKKNLDDDTT